MSDVIDRIKERISIVDVVSPYVELHKAGKNLKGKSPFTNEKTPSFYVSPDRGMYYCFSSSQGGDIFTFVEKMEGVDFKGALKILADKAGVELVPDDPKKRNERDYIYKAMELATKYFQEELGNNSEAKDYLLRRGLKSETIDLWRIGYVPGPPKGGWRHTKEALNKEGIRDDVLFSSGLIKSADPGKEPYDVFRDRIMFPIMDPSGRVVAFSGRILGKDSEAPKYVNSPETMLFHKSEILFGYDKAKDGIRKLGFSMIVEGQFDVVLSHQAGYNNTVAVSGTALTDNHISLLQRLSNKVVLALDADRAGLAAVKRASTMMLKRGIDLKVAILPQGLDPADLIASNKESFRNIVGKAIHIIDFLIQIEKTASKDERHFRLLARDEILPILANIDSQIDREYFVGRLAEALGVSIEAIKGDLAKIESKKRVVNQGAKIDLPSESKKTNLKRTDTLLQYLLIARDQMDDNWGSVINAKLIEIIGPEYQVLFDEAQKTMEIDGLRFKIEEEWASLNARQIKEEVVFTLNEFRKNFLRIKLGEYKERLNETELKADNDGELVLLGFINDLQQRLSAPPYEISIFS